MTSGVNESRSKQVTIEVIQESTGPSAQVLHGQDLGVGRQLSTKPNTIDGSLEWSHVS